MSDIASMLPLMIPIVALMIPIVAILTGHQRKMAEILAYQNRQAVDPEVAALRQEVRQLTELMHRQTIAMDDVTSRLSALSGVETFQDRISSVG